MNTLRIIGSGVKGALHLTQESISHLVKANKVLWLGSIGGLEELATQQQWQAENITHLYEDNALDVDNYNRIKTKVLTDLNIYNDIAFITLGHPRLGVTVVQELQKESDHFNLIVLPGISSFDTMINDLGLDPIEEGTCIVDVNRLLLYEYHMDPCFNYFLYHVCSIGNANTDYSNPTLKNGTSFLKEKLLKHFPANHKVILLSSSNSINEPAIRTEDTIENIEILLQSVSFASSLYIPAILPKKQQINLKFLQHITQGKDYHVA